MVMTSWNNERWSHPYSRVLKFTAFSISRGEASKCCSCERLLPGSSRGWPFKRLILQAKTAPVCARCNWAPGKLSFWYFSSLILKVIKFNCNLLTFLWTAVKFSLKWLSNNNLPCRNKIRPFLTNFTKLIFAGKFFQIFNFGVLTNCTSRRNPFWPSTFQGRLCAREEAPRPHARRTKQTFIKLWNVSLGSGWLDARIEFHAGIAPRYPLSTKMLPSTHYLTLPIAQCMHTYTQTSHTFWSAAAGAVT